MGTIAFIIICYLIGTILVLTTCWRKPPIYTKPRVTQKVKSQPEYKRQQSQLEYERPQSQPEYEDSWSQQEYEESWRQLERKKLTKSLRYDVMRRDRFRCRLCGRSSEEDGVKLEIDHIKPISKGGKTELNNLRTLCYDCNRGKRDKYDEYGPN